MSNQYKYENSEVIVRAAEKTDMVHIVDMIQELADYEKMPNGPTLTVSDLIRDGFELSPPLFRCMVAEVSGGGGGSGGGRSEGAGSPRVVGYALYFGTYSTWEGRSLMLEDLCVRGPERGRGVGARLFDAVAREAVESGCRRLDFHVLRWNPARHFYESRGATNLTETEQWCSYRLAGEPLRALARR